MVHELPWQHRCDLRVQRKRAVRIEHVGCRPAPLALLKRRAVAYDNPGRRVAFELGGAAVVVEALGRSDQPEPAAAGPTRRKRRTEGGHLVSFNANCWPSARDFLSRTDVQVVMVQETKVDGIKLVEAETWCINNGWKPFFTPCLRSDKGEVRAGTGVFVRKCISACPILGLRRGSSPASVIDGWGAAVHVDDGLAGGDDSMAW